MDPLQAAVLIVLLMVPFHLLVQSQLRQMRRAFRERRCGVALDTEEGLEARGEVIGRYDGADIHAWVSFMGLRYRFDRVAPRSYARRVREQELFLKRGLVYTVD
jgi:hypothetical protein